MRPEAPITAGLGAFLFLPFLSAAVVGLSFLAWGFASIWTEEAIGRPSSTAGLAYVFIPAWAAMLAVVGFIITGVVQALVAPSGISRKHPRYRVAVLALLVVAPALAGLYGVAGVRSDEAEARPRILISSADVVREVAQFATLPSRTADLIWDSPGSDRAPTIPAGLPTVTFDGLSATFEIAGRRSAPLELPALDYVTSAYLLSIRENGTTRGYAAIINGRATGRRSVIAVMSDDLRVLHTELVERWWPLADNPLYAEGTSSEAAIVGCAGDPAIRFRLNERRKPATGTAETDASK